MARRSRVTSGSRDRDTRARGRAIEARVVGCGTGRGARAVARWLGLGRDRRLSIGVVGFLIEGHTPRPETPSHSERDRHAGDALEDSLEDVLDELARELHAGIVAKRDQIKLPQRIVARRDAPLIAIDDLGECRRPTGGMMTRDRHRLLLGYLGDDTTIDRGNGLSLSVPIGQPIHRLVC